MGLRKSTKLMLCGIVFILLSKWLYGAVLNISFNYYKYLSWFPFPDLVFFSPYIFFALGIFIFIVGLIRRFK